MAGEKIVPAFCGSQKELRGVERGPEFVLSFGQF